VVERGTFGGCGEFYMQEQNSLVGDVCLGPGFRGTINCVLKSNRILSIHIVANFMVTVAI
jgi:hypothetical protein